MPLLAGASDAECFWPFGRVAGWPDALCSPKQQLVYADKERLERTGSLAGGADDTGAKGKGKGKGKARPPAASATGQGGPGGAAASADAASGAGPGERRRGGRWKRPAAAGA